MRPVLLTVVLLLACAPDLGAEPGRIVFREQARILGEEMTLGELARLSGGCTALADLPMGRSPMPGKATALKRLQVLNKLAAVVPQGAAEVSCPESVLILRRHQVVSRAQMVEALRAQLERRLAAGGGEVRLSEFRVTEEPLVPEGSLWLVYELPEATERLLGSVNLPLVVKVDGVAARRLHTAARVALWREVVCAAREIRRHEIVGGADLRLERREVSGLEPLLDPERALGKRAERRIEAGSVLARGDLEEPPALARGDAVTILLESGPLTITTRGMVREGGRVGDVVRVLNTDSKREVLAVIADGATVRVPFER
jgi:flagella basal body P-ring formation protein FlgA